MDIEKDERAWGQGPSAKEKVDFCIGQVEKAKSFRRGINWQTEIVPRLTVEEIVGALLHAQEQLADWEQAQREIPETER